jgi:phage gpG-like protein
MADSLTLTLKLDEITPSLARLASSKTRQRILMGMGTALESLAVRAFDEPGLRPTAWPARKPRKNGGSHPLLIKSGDLRQSIHSQLGTDAVKVGSAKPYAARHQLGSKDGSTPPRPFFPVLNDVLTGNAQAEIRDVVDALVGGAASGT